MKGVTINSNFTKNIYLNLYATDGHNVAENLVINGTDVTESVQAFVRTDSKKMAIYCPLSTGATCNLDCDNNTQTDGCQQHTIYTQFGIGKDLQFSIFFS